MIRTKDLHMQLREELASRAEGAENGYEPFIDVFMKNRLDREELRHSLELIEQWERECQEEIEREMRNYPDGKNGYEFEVRAGRRTWSFKGIPEWEQINQEKKAVEQKYKSIWEAKHKGAVHADVNEDGEQLPLPEINYSKSSLLMKKKNERRGH